MASNAHTKTYTSFKLKDIFHRQRLRKLKQIAKQTFVNPVCYCDIGSSEGYISKIIADEIKAERVCCYDWNPVNLEAGRAKTDFEFYELDLNQPQQIGPYPCVSCFETLEHIANLKSGVENVLHARAAGGSAIISVPNEVGLIGFLKAVFKLFFYGYSLDQLKEGTSRTEYLWALLANRKRISCFRTGNRKGYGSHFGFDYRDVGDIIEGSNVSCRMVRSGTTVYFIVSDPS